MTCLSILCAVYIKAAAGYQLGYEYEMEASNYYGHLIGEISIVAEFRNDTFIELKHISGLNTDEKDGGLNAITIGHKINLWSSKR